MTHRRPASAPTGRMSDAQAAATTIELGRLILCGRPARPELVPSKREILDFYREKRNPALVAPMAKARRQSSGQNPIIKGRRG